jgi:cellobiose-specific phosphotransferase system component IIC
MTFLILAIFALGGIIVSVKIGGGGDLHNLDAYLVFLAIISTYLIFYRYVPQSDYIENKIKIPFLLLIPVLFVPLYFTFQNGVSWNIKDTQSAKANVQLLQKGLDVLKNELPGPILFISERQLLSFGNIHGIELVPDYEKVFLMEMVMANNKPYLDKFHQKLEQETYSAIIIDSLSEIIQDPEDSFWVENNLWVDKVILPLLQYYEPVYTLQDRNVNVLIPRGNEKIFDQLKKLAP